jgi:hypothetical protein
MLLENIRGRCACFVLNVMRTLLVLSLSTLVACGSEDQGGATDNPGGDAAADRGTANDARADDQATDAASGLDAGPDAIEESDSSLRDGVAADDFVPDATMQDGSATGDSHLPEADASPLEAGGADGSAADSRTTDGQLADVGVVDIGTADARAADASGSNEGGGRHTPCTRGSGWVAWRFHYNANEPGTQAHLDLYDLLDASNWEANPVFSTSIVDSIHGGGLEIATGNWILIRYSVTGLTTIRSASFSVYGRSYNVTASGSFNAWTPLYGDAPAPTNSVSNAWPYEWTSIDFTGHVRAGDAPGLTGIRLYAGPSSNDLAIHAVELCLDAD